MSRTRLLTIHAPARASSSPPRSSATPEGALFDEALGGAEADAGRAAGDEGHLSFETPGAHHLFTIFIICAL